MKDFERATEYVQNYLVENRYGHTVVQANERCFRKLGAYLEQEGVDFTPEKADEWFSTHFDEIAATDYGHFKMAIPRICDFYKYGEILPDHDPKRFMSYTILTGTLKDSLELFLEDLRKTVAPATVKNYKQSCARFLVFMQKSGVRQIKEITFELLCTFDQSDIHHGKWEKPHVNAQVSSMMRFYFNRGEVPYGFSILFNYLSAGNGCYWNQVSEETHQKIVSAMADTETVDTRTLCEYRDVLVRLHADNEYSPNVFSTDNRTVDLLVLFLEMNGYRYNPCIAMLWFNDVRHCFKTEAAVFHRVLCMIADYHQSSEIRLDVVYRTRPRKFNLLPRWCREAADRYIKMKEAEEWSNSTLDMIRASICRFCNYLDSIGVRSFRDVNVSHIKQFNSADEHKTPQGKNAYNVRIRKFLICLGEWGYLGNPMLFASLTHTAAPRETVVVILTREEMEELNSQLYDDGSSLSFRKKAMLLLGLKMGMRSSDIVNLKIDDINWGTASIRFVQEKTAVEVNLPMPTEVGNALFRYITEERHHKSIPDVFLSEKAPHKPVGRGVCIHALETALPDRNVEGSGFHVTRKTYATNLLREGVGADMVAEALGQRGTTSVHRYLSLDVERMRMCPLSLADCGIGGWSNDR